MTQNRYIAYIRVSTPKQGKSMLGIEAQKAAVAEFLKRTGGQLLAEFVEIQTGTHEQRPQLVEALKLCKLTNSTLLIAKLDRLSRNAAFLLALQNAGTRFIACDCPHMDQTTVGILAVIAQSERQAISQRTKSALAAAKARGIKLGNPSLKGGNASTASIARLARSKKAMNRAHELEDVIQDSKRNGCKTLRDIASHLNRLGITTPRGRAWHASSVRLVMQRLSTSAASPSVGSVQ